MEKLRPKDIGYRGRPITDLTKEELLDAFAELSTLLAECQYKINLCKSFVGEKEWESLFKVA